MSAFSSPWAASTSPNCAQNLFGAALVLIAALTTAIYFLIGERYTHELGSTRFAAIGMSSAAVMLALHFAVFRSFGELATLAGLRLDAARRPGHPLHVHPGTAAGRRHAPRRRAARGHRQHHRPATTILLAALFLGERLNGWQLLGSAMIVGSVLVLSWPKRAAVAD